MANPRPPSEGQGARQRTGTERTEEDISEEPGRAPQPVRDGGENTDEQRAHSNKEKAELGEQVQPREPANPSKTEH